MRNNNFDLLRLILAFTVVFGHLIELTGVPEFQKFRFVFDTYIAFTGFFAISGFLIAKSYQTSSSLSSYFKKRAARILPAYLFLIISSVFLLSFVSTLSFSDYFLNSQTGKYLAANLTFLNFLQPCLPEVFEKNPLQCSVNGALWTLKIEVLYYLSVPILIFLLNKSRKKLIWIILIYVLSIAYKTTLMNIGTEKYILLARQLPGFMSYFVSGIALSYYFDLFIKYKNKIVWIAIVVFIFEKWIHIEYLMPISLSIIVFTFAYSFKKLNSLIRFGDISYGVYIFHCPIIQTATSFEFFKNYNSYFVAFVSLLIIIVVSLLSWHLNEKRWLNLYRRK